MGRGGGQSLNISCLANPPPATRRFFSVMTSFADHRETDLFGQPVRPNKGRRGRPALQVTNEGRDMLEMACARAPSEALAREAGTPIRASQTCPGVWRGRLAGRSRPVQPPRPRRWRGKLAPRSELRRPVPGAGAAGQPPAPAPRTGLRSSDRGASFPRQRLERGGCTGRDRPARRPDLTPRFADGGCPGRAGGTNRRLSGGRPGLRNCFICVVFFRVAHRGGFEPPTPRFVVWCSIQLSYRCPWRSHIHRRRAMQSRPRS
jgi:hypothetical protein